MVEASDAFNRRMATASVLLLICQAVAAVFVMRLARTRADGDVFISGCVVIVVELAKMVICCAVILYQVGSLEGLVATLRQNTVDSPRDMLKMSVPSSCYTLQNFLGGRQTVWNARVERC